MAAQIRDVTAQQRTESLLAERERTYRTLLANLPGMAYRCRNDPSWTMEFLSEGCEALTGYRPEELLHNAALSYGDLVLPEHRQTLWDQWQAALAQKRPYQGEYPIRDRAGRIRWVWEQGCGVFDSQGTLLALEGVHHRRDGAPAGGDGPSGERGTLPGPSPRAPPTGSSSAGAGPSST